MTTTQHGEGSAQAGQVGQVLLDQTNVKGCDDVQPS
jgi:hypothetical protein